MARGWKWFIGATAGLVAILAAVVLLFQWEWVRNPLAHLLTARSGRTIQIGRLQGQFSLHPRFVLADFRIGNPDWAREPDLVSADRIELVVDVPRLLHGQLALPEITLVHPKVTLERQADGTSNWTFGARQAAKAVTPQTRTEVPLIGLLQIQDGVLAYHDKKLGLDVDSRITTAIGTGKEGEGEVDLHGNGTLHGEAFNLALKGGSLLGLREARNPYPLTIDLRVGPTHGRISGTLDDPVKFEGLALNLLLAGPDLAGLTRFTGVPLPITPPYRLSGHLQRDGDLWRITDMAGKVGQSDLGGEIRIDTGKPRLNLQANLRSKDLDYHDVGALVGLKPGAEPAKPDGAAPPPRVLPDAPLSTQQVRETDVDLKFHGDRVVAPSVPLSGVDLTLAIKNGVLQMRPLDVGVAGGRVRAEIRIDARSDDVRTDYDIRLSRFRIERFLDSAGLANGGSGEIDGRIVLTGRGDTVRKSLGSANGDVRLVIGQGSLSDIAVAAIGLDIAKALGILATKAKPVPLNCLVADFGVQDGLASVRTFTLDAGDSTATGSGTVSLRDERIDLSILAHPKQTTLSARTPILVGGMFSRPEVGLKKAPLAARAAGAVALGLVGTPLASILAFIDPGLQKGIDCPALMQEHDPG